MKRWQEGVFYKMRLEDGNWYAIRFKEICSLPSGIHVTDSFKECSGWEEWYSLPHYTVALTNNKAKEA